MKTTDLKAKLKKQLERLDNQNYEATCFEIWNHEQMPEALKESIIRVERDSWSWGHCTSETCNHNSHDPYDTGDTVWLNANYVGAGENGNALYESHTGIVFEHVWRDRGHYAPIKKIVVREEGTRAEVFTRDGGNQWSIQTDSERFARFHDGTGGDSLKIRYTQDIHNRIWDILKKRRVTKNSGPLHFDTRGYVFLTEEDLNFLRSLRG